MQKIITIIGVSVLLFSCVSKKKYASLENQFNTVSSEKSSLEEVLQKLAIENDSIKKEYSSLDSLYRTEREKNASVATNKKDSKEPKEYKAKKKSTLTKAQEYDKKALFIYNFASYISWPVIKGDRFAIGIVGESPINGYLASYTNGKTISKFPVVVEPYKSGSLYQIVFVSSSGVKDFSKIKKEIQGKQVLLVTDNTILDKIGAHISFDVEGDKVNFTVNKPAIEKAGMSVSSKLINFSQN